MHNDLKNFFLKKIGKKTSMFLIEGKAAAICLRQNRAVVEQLFAFYLLEFFQQFFDR